MWLCRAILLCFLSTQLSACGFQPVYGANSGVAQALEGVAISRLTGRVGQEVRNTLYEELTPNGAPASPRYHLAIDMDEDLKSVAIRRDASVTRFDYHLSAKFTLREAATGRALFTDRAQIMTSANRLDQSEFSSVVGVDDAKMRAARTVGQDIARRLSVYFAREARL